MVENPKFIVDFDDRSIVERDCYPSSSQSSSDSDSASDSDSDDSDSDDSDS